MQAVLGSTVIQTNRTDPADPYTSAKSALADGLYLAASLTYLTGSVPALPASCAPASMPTYSPSRHGGRARRPILIISRARGRTRSSSRQQTSCATPARSCPTCTRTGQACSPASMPNRTAGCDTQSVVVVEYVGADAVDQRRVRCAQRFLASKQAGLRRAGERLERGHGLVGRPLLRPTNRAADPVQQRARGLRPDGGGNLLIGAVAT